MSLTEAPLTLEDVEWVLRYAKFEPKDSTLRTFAKENELMEFKAQARIYVDNDGKFERLNITNKSGEDRFDITVNIYAEFGNRTELLVRVSRILHSFTDA